MNYLITDLYSLPKDILIKLISTIKEDYKEDCKEEIIREYIREIKNKEIKILECGWCSTFYLLEHDFHIVEIENGLSYNYYPCCIYCKNKIDDEYYVMNIKEFEEFCLRNNINNDLLDKLSNRTGRITE